MCIVYTLSSLLIDSSEENAAIGVMKKRLIAKSILLIPNHAIIIKRNRKKTNIKTIIKFYAGGKNDAREDDRLRFL